MIKLLIGGSPCTYWSIAKTKNRETEASGAGWELFKNFLIARDKYRPDYCLYENNKSMSKAIRTQIAAEFGFDPVCINSALLSAQTRHRLYWLGRREEDGTYSRVEVEQPEDRGILMRDILESGFPLDEKGNTMKASYAKSSAANGVCGHHFLAPMAAEPVRIRTIGRGTKNAGFDSQQYNGRPAYEVRGGEIAINGKQYPIKLSDGCYIIRKLTVTECKRLQTVPESYVFPVSHTQAYKMLGNGWTVDVIAHIISHIPGITTGPVEVLSMYDGMSCGHIALDKLGVEVSRYYATENDKYAIQTTQRNYPETVQLGDAFRVRDEWWSVGKENGCGYQGAGEVREHEKNTDLHL